MLRPKIPTKYKIIILLIIVTFIIPLGMAKLWNNDNSNAQTIQFEKPHTQNNSNSKIKNTSNNISKITTSKQQPKEIKAPCAQSIPIRNIKTNVKTNVKTTNNVNAKPNIKPQIEKPIEIIQPKELTPDEKKNQILSKSEGTHGLIYIPSIDLYVPTYTATVDNAQQLVDNKNSAAALVDFFGDETLIGDHNYEGFYKINDIKLNDIMYLKQNGIITEYTCTYIDYNAHNTGSAIVLNDGHTIGNDGGISLYTCQNTWRNVTVVHFEPLTNNVETEIIEEN